jgi:hypothetical protein
LYTCNLFENNPKPSQRDFEDGKKKVDDDDVDIVSLHVHFIAFKRKKRKINGKSVI